MTGGAPIFSNGVARNENRRWDFIMVSEFYWPHEAARCHTSLLLCGQRRLPMPTIDNLMLVISVLILLTKYKLRESITLAPSFVKYKRSRRCFSILAVGDEGSPMRRAISRGLAFAFSFDEGACVHAILA